MGFMLGFTACAMLHEAGYMTQSNGMIFLLMAGAAAFVSVLPRTLLRIVRRVRLSEPHPVADPHSLKQ
jgi:hypothetical protein